MANIKKLYRKDYTGEDIITQAVYENSAWVHNKENSETFSFTINSEHALVLGNGLNRDLLPLNFYKKERGFIGSKTLTIYGCNALYRDFDPNFLIVTREAIAEEIINNNLKDNNYCKKNIVYSNINNILDYPGNFHVIPQNPGWNSGAMATYLACFDGHKKIYLLGHDSIDSPGADYNLYAGTNGYQINNGIYGSLYETNMVQVFKTYTDVDFVLVNKTGQGFIPESWKYCLNLRRLSIREFISEADI